MKSDIHPNYRPVVFRDAGAEFSFITQSTVETSDTVVWEDGRKYVGKIKVCHVLMWAILVFSCGRFEFVIEIGEFQDDKFHGPATMTWSDGREYTGQYLNGKKHGNGINYFC